MTFEQWWDSKIEIGTPDTFRGWEESCRRAWEEGAKAEREACAKVIEGMRTETGWIGKDAARMGRPAPEYLPMLPELRRRIVIESFDFGHDVHVMELYKTSRLDCFMVLIDGKPWKSRIGWAKILEALRKSRARVGDI